MATRNVYHAVMIGNRQFVCVNPHNRRKFTTVNSRVWRDLGRPELAYCDEDILNALGIKMFVYHKLDMRTAKAKDMVKECGYFSIDKLFQDPDNVRRLMNFRPR